jgi:amidase
MQTPELCYRPLTEIAEDIRLRRLSPVEVTEQILERIETIDPGLKSYTTVTADLALKQARRAESEIANGKYRGPLHGVPIAVKDLCYTTGIPTSGGMIIHKDFKPTYDATVVKRLADAGSVLLGKLHMTEGACLEHHPEMPRPVNPWKADLWTGVSSSGSGVATAAGLCYASLGSDTGGSIRFPSACNGLTGVKPTWGRVSRYGIMDLAPSYDTVGPMTRTAADAAIVLSAIAGYDPNDPTSLQAPVPDYLGALDDVYGARGMRIGIDWDFVKEGADPTSIKMIEAAADTLAELGAELRPITFPDPLPLLEHLLEMMMVELAVIHEATYPSQKKRYGNWLGNGIEIGLAAKPTDLGRVSILRDQYKGQLLRIFKDVDAILIPVFRDGTPTWDQAIELNDKDMNGLMRFTAPINATGSPTVTMPCGYTADNRPVGFQLVGAHCSEHVLLRAAHAFQQATDWHVRHPVLQSAVEELAA